MNDFANALEQNIFKILKQQNTFLHSMCLVVLKCWNGFD